jgi:hypothetical protein
MEFELAKGYLSCEPVTTGGAQFATHVLRHYR